TQWLGRSADGMSAFPTPSCIPMPARVFLAYFFLFAKRSKCRKQPRGGAHGIVSLFLFYLFSRVSEKEAHVFSCLLLFVCKKK
ncbi:MAG: hypothetical protein IKT43_02965, partial [Clostridia bacterium]|nr:hypothetical protein [Clostridia bacterium]